MLIVKRPRRLVSIAHAYSVSMSRRLANEMARAGAGEWEVTAVAPTLFYENYRPVPLEIAAGESCRIAPLKLHWPQRIHTMVYERRLRELLRQSWDLVHCWEEPFNLAGAQVAWWTPQATPFVFWTAQNLPKRYPPPFAQLENYTLERAAGWLACGQSIVETMLPRGYGRKPHRVLPLGVDVQEFYPNRLSRAAVQQSLDWDEIGAPVIGYLGRFVPEKGLELLMRALDETPSSWRALMVGGGPMEAQLRLWAARYGDRVRIVTGVAHDQVPAHLNAMDMLIAPSQTTPRWREQLGRMLIEAFACGVPVIASDSGEIPHVVSEAGMIVGEQDQAGWTRAITRMLEDASLRKELSARGIERARSVYSWPIIARQHLEFFGELLEAKQPVENIVGRTQRAGVITPSPSL
jgi:glycosyltransferase involved in cell wall biosynthesis